MSITVSGLHYTPPGADRLLKEISFSLLQSEKSSITGDNGTGKSTLLRLIAGELNPCGGKISREGKLFFVPQHYGHLDGCRICDAIGVGRQVDALAAIEAGSISEEDFSTLGDNWDIGQRITAALGQWGMEAFDPLGSMARLSGGEKTRVLLSGMSLHKPDVILLDEPTNHLDTATRNLLYGFIEKSKCTILAVSHDRTLLDLFDTTFELSHKGIRRYGGNYTFYRQQRDIELAALQENIAEGEKAARKLRRLAAETMERRQRQDSRGKQKSVKEGVPRIMMNTIRDKAENTTSGLAERHGAKIEATLEKTRRLRSELPAAGAVKIKMEDPGLYRGKNLVKGEGINFNYPGGKPLWKNPLNFGIRSGDRVQICGANGSGKTTLTELITGRLEPTGGTIMRTGFSHNTIDQEYSTIDNGFTVIGQLEKFNNRNLPPHMLRTELDRYLFPAPTWDKPCSVLSGGEKMRLCLCSILFADNAPDMLILDEPTNNLDIRNTGILASAVKDFAGTVVLISHDVNFARDIGISEIIEL